MSLQMYRVEWAIDISAESPEEAASSALRIQRDNNPRNLATVFTCIDQGGETHSVDLTALAEEKDMGSFADHMAEQVRITADCETGECNHTHCHQDDTSITRVAPAWAWDLIDETLEQDMQSKAFSLDLRANIAKAFEKMVDKEEEPTATAISAVPEHILEAYRKWATIENHDEGVIEVDEKAQVNLSEEGGAYVQAWIWVSDDEANVCGSCRQELTNNGEGYNAVCGSCADKAEEPELWEPRSLNDEHKQYMFVDWYRAIGEGMTRQSYVDWVNSQIDLHKE